MKAFKALIAVAAIALAAGTAFAVDVTSTFNLTAAVPESCSINSANNMAFGTYDGTVDVTATADFEFQCRKNTTFEIFIGRDNTLENGADTLAYNLYTDSGHLSAYPSAATGTTETAANSSPVTRTIYGKMASAQSLGGSGTYSDTATLTVQY